MAFECGLGLEFARQYLANGWRVFATCRDPASANELQRLAERSRDIVAMDVSDAQTVRAAAAEVGDVGIDILLNCAGITGMSGQKVGKVNYESWARVLDVNTMGPLRVIEAFLAKWRAVNGNSLSPSQAAWDSLSDNTSGGSIAYRSSKAAVNMVTRSAAIDLAPQGITCVVVNPGWVKTDMGGPNASLTAQESVTAIRRLIEKLGPTHSGMFFHYDGTEYPW